MHWFSYMSGTLLCKIHIFLLILIIIMRSGSSLHLFPPPIFAKATEMDLARQTKFQDQYPILILHLLPDHLTSLFVETFAIILLKIQALLSSYMLDRWRTGSSEFKGGRKLEPEAGFDPSLLDSKFGAPFTTVLLSLFYDSVVYCEVWWRWPNSFGPIVEFTLFA